MSSFITALLLSALFYADVGHAISLGEFRGEAPMKVFTADGKTGDIMQIDTRCKTAMNIYVDSQLILIPFTMFDCQGFKTWNEPKATGKIFAGKIWNEQGLEIGQVLPNNVYRFEDVVITNKTVDVTTYGLDCAPLRTQAKTFQLKKTVFYTVHKLSDRSFRVVMNVKADVLQTVYSKPSPQCSSVVDYVQSVEARDFDVEVEKPSI
jgi:hypothetical protein